MIAGDNTSLSHLAWEKIVSAIRGLDECSRLSNENRFLFPVLRHDLQCYIHDEDAGHM